VDLSAHEAIEADARAHRLPGSLRSHLRRRCSTASAAV
jgi:hypothetical protein